LEAGKLDTEGSRRAQTVPRVALEQPEVLFAEITEPVGVREDAAADPKTGDRRRPV
jgi:hypothetical protein